jgi:hypothetical protein
VIVHQALHGYDRGHRLLAMSVELAMDDRQVMLVQSDLSGPRESDGFEQYLSGYSLPSGEYYVLARTWLATEMPRPGCVWTHSILIPARALGNVASFGLITHHRRPRLPISIDSYEKPLSITPGDDSPVQTDLGASLLDGLYGQPQTGLWISSANSEAFEGTILAVWDQEWPALRKQLAFSTGSLAPRHLKSRLFDVQVVPKRDVSMWGRVHDAREVQQRTRPSAWAKLGAKDLDSPGPFRSFLHHVGFGGRESYRPLAELYATAEVARDEVGVRVLFETLAETPLSASARRSVAKELLADDGLEDEAVLLAVAADPDPPEWVTSAANIRGRTQRLLDRDLEKMWAICRRLSDLESGVAKLMLSGLAKHLKSDDLLDRPDEDWPVIRVLVALSPPLAAAPEFWQLPPSIQRDLIDQMDHSPRRSEIPVVLKSMAIAASNECLEYGATFWPEETVVALLDAAQESVLPSELPSAAVDLLARSVVSIRRWVTNHDHISHRALKLMSETLDPDDLTGAIASPTWTTLVLDSDVSEFSSTSIAFLFVQGIHPVDGSRPPVVLTATFDRLYQLTYARNLSERAWSLLESRLPHLGFMKDWDRCERICRATVAAFVAADWPPAALLRLSPSRDVQKQLTKALRHVDGSKGYLKRHRVR